jgi:hypothetical protein
MDSRLAFNVEVNIAKVGNFAEDGNVATKSAPKVFFSAKACGTRHQSNLPVCASLALHHHCFAIKV